VTAGVCSRALFIAQHVSLCPFFTQDLLSATFSSDVRSGKLDFMPEMPRNWSVLYRLQGTGVLTRLQLRCKVGYWPSRIFSVNTRNTCLCRQCIIHVYKTVVNKFRDWFNIRAYCKPEGRGLETRWGELIFFPIYLIPLTVLGRGFTQPLTEVSTRSRKMFLGSRTQDSKIQTE
jgi:hypothetical protein